MTADLNYFSTTRPDALASGLTSTETSVVLVDGSTFPDPVLNDNKPYTIILGYGTDREEVATVTAKPTANTLTVIRGQDTTPATAKNAGDVVVHGVSARDFKRVDTLIITKVERAGDTMEGPLILSGPPTADLGAATKKYVDDAKAEALDEAVPVGMVGMFGAAAPAGWVLCDGRAHNSPALLAYLGSPNTPDLRDRFIRAPGTNAVGDTGGADQVTLTAAQSGLPAHNHGLTVDAANASHSHSVDPPNTATDTSANHNHGGATGWMDRNASHSHGAHTYEGVTTGDSNKWIDTADAATPATTRDGTVTILATNTDHQHSISAQGAHAHNVNIASFTSGSAATNHSHGGSVSNNASSGASAAHENRPAYYVLTFAIKA